MPLRRAGHPPGKLKAVARRWASGRGGKAPAGGDPLTAASAAFIDSRTFHADPEIGPNEREAVILFLTLSTQWRFDGVSGRRIGMDYGVIGSTAAMLGITMDASLLHDVRVMEAEALNVFGARA